MKPLTKSFVVALIVISLEMIALLTIIVPIISIIPEDQPLGETMLILFAVTVVLSRIIHEIAMSILKTIKNIM